MLPVIFVAAMLQKSPQDDIKNYK